MNAYFFGFLCGKHGNAFSSSVVGGRGGTKGSFRPLFFGSVRLVSPLKASFLQRTRENEIPMSAAGWGSGGGGGRDAAYCHKGTIGGIPPAKKDKSSSVSFMFSSLHCFASTEFSRLCVGAIAGVAESLLLLLLLLLIEPLQQLLLLQRLPLALLLHGAVVGSLWEAEIVVHDPGRPHGMLLLLLLLLPAWRPQLLVVMLLLHVVVAGGWRGGRRPQTLLEKQRKKKEIKCLLKWFRCLISLRFTCRLRKPLFFF